MKRLIFLFLIMFNITLFSQYKVYVNPNIEIKKEELDKNNIQIEEIISLGIKRIIEQTKEQMLLDDTFEGAKQEEVEFFLSFAMEEAIKISIESIKYETKNRARVNLAVQTVDREILSNDKFSKKLGFETEDAEIDLTDKKIQEKFKKAYIEGIKESKKNTEYGEIIFEKINEEWEIQMLE